MSVILEVNGTPYTNFLTGSITSVLPNLARSFSFTCSRTDNEPLPFREGDPCKVRVNNQVVLTGFIEILTVDYNSDAHLLNISGRDKLGDLIDSTLDNLSDLKPPISLKQIIETTIATIGLDIDVIERTETDLFNAAEDLIAPKPGKPIFDFLEKYARKRNVLLTSDSDGNIVITQSTQALSGAIVQNIIGSNRNNILAGNITYDTTGRFNTYKFASSLNPTALNLAGAIDLAAVVDQSGGITDAEVRKTRQLILIAETPFSDGQCETRARWEANIRRARSATYSATVQGYENQNGELWEVNTLVSVKDDFAGINDQMLLDSVTFNISLDGGSTTNLGFVDKEAYTLALSEPVTQTTSVGLGLGLT